MSTRTVSRSMEEAKQRLKQALESVESVAQAQLAALERELQETTLREKSAREQADKLLHQVGPRLDEMSGEILNILKSAGAQ